MCKLAYYRDSVGPGRIRRRTSHRVQASIMVRHHRLLSGSCLLLANTLIASNPYCLHPACTPLQLSCSNLGFTMSFSTTTASQPPNISAEHQPLESIHQQTENLGSASHSRVLPAVVGPDSSKTRGLLSPVYVNSAAHKGLNSKTLG